MLSEEAEGEDEAVGAVVAPDAEGAADGVSLLPDTDGVAVFGGLVFDASFSSDDPQAASNPINRTQTIDRNILFFILLPPGVIFQEVISTKETRILHKD
jgi:hypothetical protein